MFGGSKHIICLVVGDFVGDFMAIVKADFMAIVKAARCPLRPNSG